MKLVAQLELVLLYLSHWTQTEELLTMNNPTNYSDEDCIALFLEWYNDFLTVARFAEYHSLTTEDADRIIAYGKHCHNLATDANT